MLVDSLEHGASAITNQSYEVRKRFQRGSRKARAVFVADVESVFSDMGELAEIINGVPQGSPRGANIDPKIVCNVFVVQTTLDAVLDSFTSGDTARRLRFIGIPRTPGHAFIRS